MVALAQRGTRAWRGSSSAKTVLAEGIGMPEEPRFADIVHYVAQTESSLRGLRAAAHLTATASPGRVAAPSDNDLAEAELTSDR